MDEELYTLIKIIKALGLYREVAEALGIKPSSFRRQINRLEAFHEGRKAQSRSGRRRGAEYKEAMRKAIERELGRPVLTDDAGARRKIQFPDLKDALRYSDPIAHIARVKNKKEYWEVEIPDDSNNMTHVAAGWGWD